MAVVEKITNCYDSHTHFWATGQVAEGLQLNGLKNVEEVRTLVINENHYRANWLTGFGWNHNHWPTAKFPHKKTLDEVFKKTPVFFSRVDGHASWINSQAIIELKKLGYDFSADPKGGVIERDETGEPTGILFDQAHINALLRIPDFSEAQNYIFLKKAQSIFNRAGFTHIRDMSMNLNFWQILNKMEDQKNLTVCIDAFVTIESLNDLDRGLKEIGLINKNKSRQLRLQGVKIFIDGSLGSGTAHLSQAYLNSKKGHSKGILIWSLAEIKELLKKSWVAGQQVAIHTIGDQAVHTAVVAAREVAAEGVLGLLHLEHVQILRPETVQMMKPLHVTCHMQPCHWLSDNSWLKQALPDELIKNLFQWELLRKNKIPVYFGSDSPVEAPSLFANKRALDESQKWGVPSLNAEWKLFHTHPDGQWMNSFSEIENNKIKQVYFNNEAIL